MKRIFLWVLTVGTNGNRWSLSVALYDMGVSPCPVAIADEMYDNQGLL